jgi:hypothetical protein
MIILPHGALVLEESRKTPLALREDANATYSESGLPKCNARHRRKHVRAQGVRLPSAFITGLLVCPKTPELTCIFSGAPIKNRPWKRV